MKPIDGALYWYTFTLSLILTANAVMASRTPSQLLAFALLLPVPLYVILQGIKRLYLWRQTLAEAALYVPAHSAPPMPTFSVHTFFAQRQPLFWVTLFFYALVLMMICIKLVTRP